VGATDRQSPLNKLNKDIFETITIHRDNLHLIFPLYKDDFTNVFSNRRPMTGSSRLDLVTFKVIYIF